MWQDPIVKETRKHREEYASRFAHDPDAIIDEVRKRQAEAGKRTVSFPPRKPRKGRSAA